MHAASKAESHRVTWEAHRNEVRRHLPATSLLELSDDRLDRLARLTYHHATLAEELKVLPHDRQDLGLRIGANLIAIGREDAGRARMASLEPEDPLELASWIRLARAWAEIGRTEEVERIHGRIIEARSLLLTAPPFADYRRWEESLANFWPEMGRHLETAGRLAEAYDLLRVGGCYEPALSLLFRRDLVDPMIKRYGSELRAQIEGLPPAPAVADLETLERLYDLGLKLTEVQLLGQCYSEAVDTFGELLDLVPVDQEFHKRGIAAAMMADREDKTLEFLRRKVSPPAEGGVQQPRGWDPSRLLEPMPMDGQLWIRNARVILSRSGSAQVVGLSTTGSQTLALGNGVRDRMQILTLELKLEQTQAIQDTLAELRLLAAGFRPDQHEEFAQLVLSDGRLGSCLELIELGREGSPTSVPLLGQHARLLIGMGRFDDAEAEMAAFPEPLRARATIARRRKQIRFQQRWRAAVDELEGDDG